MANKCFRYIGVEIITVLLLCSTAFAGVPNNFRGIFSIKKCSSEGSDTFNVCTTARNYIQIQENLITICHLDEEEPGCNGSSDKKTIVIPPPSSNPNLVVKEISLKAAWSSVATNPRYGSSISMVEYGPQLLKIVLKEECSDVSGSLCLGSGGFAEIWFKRN